MPAVVETKNPSTQPEKETPPTATHREVAFDVADPHNPQEWPAVKRWRVLAVALFITFTSCYNSTGNGAAKSGVMKEFGISEDVFQVSSFAYQLMLGVGPLFLAPISETFGRRPMLVALTAIITVLFLPQALAPNYASLCATRFFQGACGSVEGPVISGIVADMWPKRTRGRAMAIFVATVFAANSCGVVISTWMAERVSWRWIYWLQMITCGTSCLLVILFLPETRGELILSKRADALTKETGEQHYIRGGDRFDGFLEKVKVSSTRPLVYLATEPAVLGCATWVGCMWGIVFLFTGAVTLVFKNTYPTTMSSGYGATTQLTGLIGALFGVLENELIQEPLYRRAVKQGGGKAKPEARLYSSVGGALCFAIGTLCFGWTARPHIHWIAPCIFLAMAQFGLYIIYLATYNYLAEVYDRYSSSAQAAQSLLRGIMGAVFPFFALKLYERLSYPDASTVIACVGFAFVAMPLALIRYGATLRTRSKVAQQLSHEEGEVLHDGEEDAVIARIP
ncbi:hypothetical protein JCM10207_002552 [Rhodosporidiobolus poonsookiae]